jgi:hypothetical protein
MAAFQQSQNGLANLLSQARAGIENSGQIRVNFSLHFNPKRQRGNLADASGSDAKSWAVI